jgi:hypothetical protein
MGRPFVEMSKPDEPIHEDPGLIPLIAMASWNPARSQIRLRYALGRAGEMRLSVYESPAGGSRSSRPDRFLGRGV